MQESCVSEDMDQRLVEELRRDIRTLTEQVSKLNAGFEYMSKQVAESAGLAARVAVLEARQAEQERATNSTRWLIGIFIVIIVAVVGWLSKGGVH
jgi:hypothetical protein